MNNQDPQEAEFQQFMLNPIQNLMSVGLNIPRGMNNPDDILNYLLSSGKITQEQCNQAIMKSRVLGSMIPPRR